MRLIFLLIGFLCFARLSFAGGLFVPHALESASVLPKGVRSVRVTTLTTEIEQSPQKQYLL